MGTNVVDFSSSRSPGIYEQKSFALLGGNLFSSGVPAFLGILGTTVASLRHEALRTPPRQIPHMISRWAHFRSYIGEPASGPRLAGSVRGFFENGGRCCYVVVLKDCTDDSLEAGLLAISDLNTIDLVCTPDLDPERTAAIRQQQMVVSHCDRLGDRFAILDSHRGDNSNEVWNQWSEIDGKNGALYYPWIQVRDFSGRPALLPPCGYIAGIYSRTDRGRGVHKAPANEPLVGVTDLERNLSAHDQDFLNPKGVNCLRSFPGRGIRVWGARTLSGHSNWTYINIRRLFLTAARWMEWNLRELVFEPNNEKLWGRIERKLNGYFNEQYRLGALKGASAQGAFYVKCDMETNTPETRALGQVVAEIGLAPATPYEFILVRLILGEKGTRASGFSTTQEFV